ncbi:NAD-dependent epimerase/dehydratase family protein [Bacillus salitolerans]|uniref:NAD-dependent epimerase/dehydratase family protein n=1 Tax=Bacillus salitolerans TaxID=1437434 RepID=A0ABW4LPS5_9BACI
MSNSKKILIIGSGGFIGSNIYSYLEKSGLIVFGIGRTHKQTNRRHINLTLPDKNFLSILEELQPDVIIHCAGSSSVSQSIVNPYEDFQNNVGVCAFILEAIRQRTRNTKFILLSSAAVYGNPTELPIRESANLQPISPYGYHKKMCEELVEEYSHQFSLNYTIFRIFSAFGEGLKRQVIYELCTKFVSPENNIVEVFGTGNESRDFIHVSDIARAVKFSLDSDIIGIYNLASGNQTKINYIVKLIQDISNSSKDVVYNNVVRSGDPIYWEADISKLMAAGFLPSRELEESLLSYFNWFMKEGYL